MIKRTLYREIVKAMDKYPVIVITGARQVGKTTLAEQLRKEYSFTYVDLTDRIQRQMAINDPSYFIESHGYPLVIDEIQYAPALLEVIETIVNKRRRLDNDSRCQFILTGSQAFAIMKDVNQSMAGRAAIFSMEPLSTSEIRGLKELPFIPTEERLSLDRLALSVSEVFELIATGFYPSLHANPQNINTFYNSYLNTYIERDVKDLLVIKDQSAFLRFLQLLASMTSQQLNINTISKAIGISNKTISSWLSVLESSGIIYLLQPYFDSSLTKRIVKSPKVYFADTGLACYLARISDAKSLEVSIFGGAFMETYVMNEIRKSFINNGLPFTGTYYRDSNGNEIDLVLLENGKLHLVEIKKGIEFKADAIFAFRQLKSSRYPISHSCLICNTPSKYPVVKGVDAIPISYI